MFSFLAHLGVCKLQKQIKESFPVERKLHTVHATDSLGTVLQHLAKTGQHHVWVTGPGGRPTKCISQRDILTTLLAVGPVEA